MASTLSNQESSFAFYFNPSWTATSHGGIEPWGEVSFNSLKAIRDYLRENKDYQTKTIQQLDNDGNPVATYSIGISSRDNTTELAINSYTGEQFDADVLAGLEPTTVVSRMSDFKANATVDFNYELADTSISPFVKIYSFESIRIESYSYSETVSFTAKNFTFSFNNVDVTETNALDIYECELYASGEDETVLSVADVNVNFKNVTWDYKGGLSYGGHIVTVVAEKVNLYPSSSTATVALEATTDNINVTMEDCTGKETSELCIYGIYAYAQVDEGQFEGSFSVNSVNMTFNNVNVVYSEIYNPGLICGINIQKRSYKQKNFVTFESTDGIHISLEDAEFENAVPYILGMDILAATLDFDSSIDVVATNVTVKNADDCDIEGGYLSLTEYANTIAGDHINVQLDGCTIITDDPTSCITPVYVCGLELYSALNPSSPAESEEDITIIDTKVKVAVSGSTVCGLLDVHGMDFENEDDVFLGVNKPFTISLVNNDITGLCAVDAIRVCHDNVTAVIKGALSVVLRGNDFRYFQEEELATVPVEWIKECRGNDEDKKNLNFAALRSAYSWDQYGDGLNLFANLSVDFSGGEEHVSTVNGYDSFKLNCINTDCDYDESMSKIYKANLTTTLSKTEFTDVSKLEVGGIFADNEGLASVLWWIQGSVISTSVSDVSLDGNAFIYGYRGIESDLSFFNATINVNAAMTLSSEESSPKQEIMIFGIGCTSVYEDMTTVDGRLEIELENTTINLQADVDNSAGHQVSAYGIYSQNSCWLTLSGCTIDCSKVTDKAIKTAAIGASCLDGIIKDSTIIGDIVATDNVDLSIYFSVVEGDFSVFDGNLYFKKTEVDGDIYIEDGFRLELASSTIDGDISATENSTCRLGGYSTIKGDLQFAGDMDQVVIAGTENVLNGDTSSIEYWYFSEFYEYAGGLLLTQDAELQDVQDIYVTECFLDGLRDYYAQGKFTEVALAKVGFTEGQIKVVDSTSKTTSSTTITIGATAAEGYKGARLFVKDGVLYASKHDEGYQPPESFAEKQSIVINKTWEEICKEIGKDEIWSIDAKLSLKRGDGSAFNMDFTMYDYGFDVSVYGLESDCNAKIIAGKKDVVLTEVNLQGKSASTGPTVYDSQDERTENVVFFAKAEYQETWEKIYSAHYSNDKTEQDIDLTVSLEGKNKITDVFIAQDDTPSVIVLTDTPNGDALFLDDLYSDAPNGFEKAARLQHIQTVYAGAGDDIIDCTSFYFQSETHWRDLILYGGDGNDQLWGDNCYCELHGDGGDDILVGGCYDDVFIGGTGNDIMYSGGGYDEYIFHAGWGNDIIYLGNESSTLYFSGDIDIDSLVETAVEGGVKYTLDDDNSVTIIGTASFSLSELPDWKKWYYPSNDMTTTIYTTAG